MVNQLQQSLPAGLIGLVALLVSGCQFFGSSSNPNSRLGDLQGTPLVLNTQPFVPEGLRECEANSTATLHECATHARHGNIDLIRVTTWIDVSSLSFPIFIHDRTAPFYIVGNGPSSSGFRRSSNYDTQIIRVDGSEINIYDLGIDEELNVIEFPPQGSSSPRHTNLACGSPFDPAACASSIFIFTSENSIQTARATIDNVSIFGSKSQGISNLNSELSVHNSTIEDAGFYGIWMSKSVYGSEIANNTILRTHSGGLFYAANGTSAHEPARIIGNTFIGNHKLPDYCSPNDWICGGGQIALFGDASGFVGSNLLVAFNELRDAQIEYPYPNSAHADGIEFTYGLENISVIHNYVHDNQGFGMFRVMNGSWIFDQISVSHNVLHNNGSGNLANLSGVESDNCEGSSCQWRKPQGELSAIRLDCLEEPCPIVVGGQVIAEIDLSSEPYVRCENLSEAGTQGQVTVELPATTAQGTRCDLYSDMAQSLLLDRKYIP